MNTPDDLPEDEMVSAVLDGEADDATRDRVMDSPLLAERHAGFAAMRDDLRSFTVPEGLLDDIRRAVVEQTAPPITGPVAPVFALSAKRARRAKAAAWIGAAAAAVLLVVAIGVTGGGDDGDGSSDASTAAFGAGSGSTGSQALQSSELADSGRTAAPGLSASTGATGSTGSGAASAGTKSTATGASAAAAPPFDLGAVADLDALVATYRARWSRVPTTLAQVPTAPSSNSNCGDATAAAVLDGRPVLLLADGARIVVVDRSTCAPIGGFIR